MLNRRSVWVVAVLFVAAMSIACSKGPSQQAAADQKQMNKARKELATYKQLAEDANSAELATSIGRDLIKRFPGTEIETEVQKTLPGLEAKVKSLDDDKRSAAAWAYRTSDDDDIIQHIASLESANTPGEAQKVKLMLRRHGEWGQSVYLHGNETGFECSTPCNLSVWFDSGQRESWPGSIPAGEPAIYIGNDSGFIQKLDAAKRITFAVRRKGMGTQTLVYEVGGFNPKRWPKLSE